MTIHLSAEVGSDTVSTDGEELTCQTTIRTDVDKIDSDLPKHLALCIDSSNSMEGRKIKHAREGIKRAVDVLDDHDFVSIVEFSGSVSRVLDPTQCGPNRQRIKREVDSISTTGGTNIIAGMKEAKSALKEKSGSGLLNTVLSNDEEFIEWIVLVSDGNPTTVPDLISTLMPHKDKTDRHISVAEEFADDGLTIQSVGVGTDYNEEIMRGVAEATRGKMEHISEPTEIRTFLESIVGEADDIVGINPTLKIQPKDEINVGEVYQHEPVLNEFEMDRHRGALVTGLPDIGTDVDQEILIEFEVPPDDPGVERLVLEIELDADGETAKDSVVIEYSEEETGGLTLEDQKRIDTKARRLAVNESPDAAMSYLDRHDEAVVLDETRDHIEQLQRAEGNDDRTLKLKSDLTRPGLTKPSDASTSSEIDTATDAGKSAESGETNPSDTDDASIEGEHADPKPESGAETTGEDTDSTTSDDPTVESIDADPSDPSMEEPSDSDDSGRTALALIPSQKTIKVDKPLDLEVRDETGARVADATIEFPSGTTSTDDRGTCTVRLVDPGDTDLRVSKEGAYSTDTASITVEGGTAVDDGVNTGEATDPESETDGHEKRTVTGANDRETTTEDDGDGSVDTDTKEAAEDEKKSSGSTSVAPVPEKTTIESGETVEFTVRDAQGNRIANAVVESKHESEKTDNRGQCRLTFDSAGTYEVSVVDGPGAPYESDTVSITVE